MSQYVVQIQDSDGWLSRSFLVTPESPIPSPAPSGTTQVVMTNTVNYDDLLSQYDTHTKGLVFSYDSGSNEISCTGAGTKTWSID